MKMLQIDTFSIPNRLKYSMLLYQNHIYLRTLNTVYHCEKCQRLLHVPFTLSNEMSSLLIRLYIRDTGMVNVVIYIDGIVHFHNSPEAISIRWVYSSILSDRMAQYMSSNMMTFFFFSFGIEFIRILFNLTLTFEKCTMQKWHCTI